MRILIIALFFGVAIVNVSPASPLQLRCNGSKDEKADDGRWRKLPLGEIVIEVDLTADEIKFSNMSTMKIWSHDARVILFKREHELLYDAFYDTAYGELNRLSGRGVVNLVRSGDLRRQLTFECHRLQQKF
jgi:hypothetical protein